MPKSFFNTIFFPNFAGLPLWYVTEIIQPQKDVPDGNPTRAIQQIVVGLYQDQNLWSLIHLKTKRYVDINPWSLSSHQMKILHQLGWAPIYHQVIIEITTICQNLSKNPHLQHIRQS